jgi:hypothetical protein
VVSLLATPKMVRVRRRTRRSKVEGLSLVLVLERIDLDAGMELSLESLALKPPLIFGGEVLG